MNRPNRTPLAPLLQQFFIDRLQKQRQASPCTISAYRDTFRLFLAFAEAKLRKRPSDLTIEDLTTHLILAFLDHLERNRKNTIRTRNARFAAIRSFIQYVGFKEPAALALTHGVLGIPMKRFDRRQIGFLSREHIEAIVAAPDTSTWVGRRDHVLLATLYNTGARVSEIIGIQVDDLNLSSSSSVRLRGKGRKERHLIRPVRVARSTRRFKWRLVTRLLGLPPHGRANYQRPGPSHLTKGVVRFKLPAILRLRLKPQRCQKNINLPIETGPIVLYQRHAPDALLVRGDNRRYRSRV
jgi:site-specific recombinase XerD